MSTPTPTGPLVQHHDVKLVAGEVEVDWASVLSTAQQNVFGVDGLTNDAAKGGADLAAAFGHLSDHLGKQVSDALTGFGTGIQNALTNGWYAKDDGYVFGLFGGTLTGAQGTLSGSLIDTLSKDVAHILSPQGFEHLFSDFNNYTLELTDHTLKPLLGVLVDETTKGVTTHGIPFELSTIQTNLLDTFADYNELKDALKALLSPEITAQLVLTRDLDFIVADFTGGDTTQGFADLNNLSSDVFGAFLNGADVNPDPNVTEFFAGLLSDGGLLQHLALTWPEQIVTALGSLGAA